jgi:hypothetical protein
LISDLCQPPHFSQLTAEALQGSLEKTKTVLETISNFFSAMLDASTMHNDPKKFYMLSKQMAFYYFLQ